MPWPIIGKLFDRWFPKDLPPEAIRQLKALGYTSEESLEKYKQIWRHRGGRYFWNSINDERDRRRSEYPPRLREYAAQCRIDHPLPSLEDLSPVDVVRFRILCDKISECDMRGGFDLGKKNGAAIINGNIVTLLAAQTTLNSSSESIILLFPEEQFRWFEEWSPPDFWYSEHTWRFFDLHELEGERMEDEKELITQNYPKPENFEYWILRSYECFGSEGSGNSELWKWDGEQAEPIEVFAYWIS